MFERDSSLSLPMLNQITQEFDEDPPTTKGNINMYNYINYFSITN